MIQRLECLETSPVLKFAAGLDLNPSLSGEMTVAPFDHQTGNCNWSWCIAWERRIDKQA